jgi:hypothetical protein
MLKKLNRYIIFDPMGEYTEGIVFRRFADLLNYMKTHHTKRFKCICRFDTDYEYDQTIELAKEVTNLWIIVEEITSFVSVHSKSKSFDNLIRLGRHYRISIIGITQRAAEIPRLYTSQIDELISFLQTEPRDIQWLTTVSFVGVEGAAAVTGLVPIQKGIIKDENICIFTPQ